METKLLEKHGEPGGARSRGYRQKHATYSFCDVRQSLELLILQDSRTLPYVYSTRGRREAEVCKTFIRRFDSDPRLQFPTTLSACMLAGVVNSQLHAPGCRRSEVPFNFKAECKSWWDEFNSAYAERTGWY